MYDDKDDINYMCVLQYWYYLALVVRTHIQDGIQDEDLSWELELFIS